MLNTIVAIIATLASNCMMNVTVITARHYFAVSATAKGWFSQCTCVYIYSAYKWMVVLSNPGTYGTRKCSSWCADIHKGPEYKHPEIQHSKNPKIQKSKIQKTQKPKNPKIQKSKTFYIYGILQFFWIFGFWDFLCSTLVFQSVETAPKLDSEKNGVCIGIYTVFKGCASRRGGDHIYIYVYICIYIYVYIYMYIYIYGTPPH